MLSRACRLIVQDVQADPRLSLPTHILTVSRSLHTHHTGIGSSPTLRSRGPICGGEQAQDRGSRTCSTRSVPRDGDLRPDWWTQPGPGEASVCISAAAGARTRFDCSKESRGSEQQFACRAAVTRSDRAYCEYGASCLTPATTKASTTCCHWAERPTSTAAGRTSISQSGSMEIRRAN